MAHVQNASADTRLLQRVYGEYLEMPGLRLTLAQACRLWNVDQATSLDVLTRLVDDQFLRVTGAHYVRAASGRPIGRA
jgi:hypothetical protein